MGWRGLIVIRSANDEPGAQVRFSLMCRHATGPSPIPLPRAQAEYLAAGADGSFGKGLLSQKDVAAQLASLYRARFDGAHAD